MGRQGRYGIGLEEDKPGEPWYLVMDHQEGLVVARCFKHADPIGARQLQLLQELVDAANKGPATATTRKREGDTRILEMTPLRPVTLEEWLGLALTRYALGGVTVGEVTDSWMFSPPELPNLEALRPYLRHGRDGDPICERSKHSDYPCTCGLEDALRALETGKV